MAGTNQTLQLGKAGDLAYLPYTYGLTDKGHLMIKSNSVPVIKAKLQLWDKYFLPSPKKNKIIGLVKKIETQEVIIYIGLGVIAVETIIILIIK